MTALWRTWGFLRPERKKKGEQPLIQFLHSVYSARGLIIESILLFFK